MIAQEDPYRAKEHPGRGLNFYSNSLIQNEEWLHNPRTSTGAKRASTMRSDEGLHPLIMQK